jgi:hypothetical protein
MEYMFKACAILTGPANIGTWSTSSVMNMSGMFYQATSFNQPIGNWSTSAVTNMQYMFGGATAFNQPIGNWTLNAAVNLASMLDFSGMSCVNYSGTLNSWNNNPATPDSRDLGADGLQYGTNAVAARNTLTGAKGWAISGDAPIAGSCKTIVTAQTGPWHIGSTWVGGVVPTSTDNATILATHTVTLTTTAQFNDLTINAGGALLQPNTGTLEGASITNNGTLEFIQNIGGVTTHTVESDITNNGTLNWSGGNIPSASGKTIFNYGTFNIPAANAIFGLNVVNKNGGTVNRTGANNQTIPTVFTNEAGATLNVLSGATLTFTDSLHNSGTVAVPGTLALQGGSHTFEGGTFGGTGFLNFNGATTITSSIGFVPAFDTINLNNTATISGGPNTAMTLPAATTFIAANTNTINGFTGITNNGTLELIQNIGGVTTHTVESDITNNGTLNWSGGNIPSASGKTIFNYGTFNIPAANAIFGLNVVNKNGGTVNRTGANNQTIPTVFTNEAGATLNVLSGATLTFTDSLHNSGTVAVPGTLALQGGSHTFEGGTFGGTGFLNFNGATTITSSIGFVPAFDTINLNNTATISGGPNTAMTLPAATTFIAANTNTINGFTGITNNGTLELIQNIGGVTTHTVESDITNNGTLNWSGGNIPSASGKTIFNYGTFNIPAANAIFGLNVVNKSGGTVNRTGANNQIIPTKFINEAGATLNVLSGATLTFTDSLHNSGTVAVPGTLTLQGGSHTFEGGTFGGTGFLNFSGTTTITSTTGFVPAFDTINLPNTATISGGPNTAMTLPAATTFIATNTNTITGFTGITNNGTLEFIQTLSGIYNHTIESDITNNGTLNWSGANMISASGKTIFNYGTFNIPAANFIFGLNVENKSGGTVNRTGANNQIIPTTFINEAGATLNVLSGAALTFTNALHNSGTVAVPGTLTLQSGSHTFEGGTFGGTGFLNFSGTTTITSSTGFVPAFDTINLPISATISGGPNTAMTLPAATTFIVNNTNTITGFTGITNNGTLEFIQTLSGIYNHTIESDITNNGILNWSGGNMPSASGKTIFNYGTFNIPAALYTFTLNVENKSGGTVNRTGTGNQTLSGAFTNEAGGTVNVTNGTLTLAAAGTHGGAFLVNTGTTLSFANTTTNSQITGATFTNNGTVSVGTGRYVVFSGSAAQTLSGDGSFASLAVNNPAHLSIPGAQTLTNLDLLNGNILLGNSDLVVTNIAGGSASSFVATTGTGRLQSGTSTIAKLFHIGPSATQYNPVTLRNVSGTSTFAVRVQVGLDNPISDPAKVDRQWDINRIAGTAGTDVTLHWTSPDDESPAMNLNNIHIARWDGAMWQNFTSGPATCSGLCSRTAAGVTDFTSFTSFTVAGNPLCNIAVSTIDVSHETCPNANDGTLTVTANCLSCENGNADIQYAVNGGPFQSSNVFTGLGDGNYTVTVRDVNEQSCQDSDNTTINAGVDNVAPTITCPVGSPFARNTDAGACTYAVQGTEFDPTAFGDNCPGATITNNFNNSATLANAALPAGPTMITWTVAAGSNQATCQITVNVADNQTPTITCPTGSPFALNTDASACNYMVQGAEFNPTAFGDNCSGATIANSFNNTATLANAALPTGPTTITWTVTGGSNQATCQITINVTDNQAPTVTCPAPLTVSANAGTCVASVVLQTPEFEENCGLSTFSQTIDGIGSHNPIFVNSGLEQPRQVIADQDGNLIVGDLKLIGAAFSGLIYRYDGSAGALLNEIGAPLGSTSLAFPRGLDLGADGNLYVSSMRSNQVLRFNPVTGAFIDVFVPAGTGGLAFPTGLVFGPDGNLYVAGFNNGIRRYNGTTGAFIDVFVPVGSGGLGTAVGITFGPDGNFYVCDFSNSAIRRYNSTTGAYIDAFVTPALGGLNGPQDLEFGPNGDLYVTSFFTGEVLRYQGTTGAFVQSVSPELFFGGALDGLTFGPDGSLYVSGVTLDRIFRIGGAVDFPVGTTDVTASVSDLSGNTATCSYTVTVTDNEPPTITCPTGGPFARNTDPSSCQYTVQGIEFDPTAFDDNCPGATITNDFNNSAILAGTVLPAGSTTIIWTVTDDTGVLSTTCQFVVNVTDNQPPTITCPTGSPITRNTDAGACTYAVQGTEFDPTAFGDNCPGATISNDFNNSATLANAVLPNGSTPITWTVTAGSNQATCQITVNVLENQPPMITCPTGSPFARNTDVGACTYTVQGTAFDPTAFDDNCPGATISNSFNNTATLANADLPNGSTTITWTVTDGSNQTTCQITVEVTDNQPPTITCPTGSPIARNADPNSCQYTVQGVEFNPTASGDNCPGATITNDFNNSASLAGAVLPGGSTTITWTVTDAALLSTTCQITVDVRFPEINVLGNSVVIADGDATPDAGDHTDFGSVAECSGSVARTFTIQNTGNANLTVGTPVIGGTHAADFSVTALPAGTVTPGNNTSFQITFDPTAIGLRSATISFPNGDCDGNPFNFAIQGLGTGPEIEVSGNNTGIADGAGSPNTTNHTDFGSTTACTGSIARTFTIQNTGNTDLTVGTPVIAGTHAADFMVTAFPTSPVMPGGNTTLEITFTPSGDYLHTATVSFANGDCLENPYDFAIQGSRGGPKAGISGNNTTIADGDGSPGFADHTDFGSMPECTGTIVRTFTIQNTGNANLTVGTLVIGGAQASDFTLTSPPASSVAPGGSTTFQITFDPSAIGLRSATVSVAVNDCDIADYNFSIQGTGTYPEMDVFGNSAPITNGDAVPGLADHTDFGGTATCTGTVVRTFTIENNGIGDLNIGAPTLSGTDAANFAVTAAPASPVAPGAGTTFQITFATSEAGLRSATVTLTNNDCDENPYTFAVQGTGNGSEIAVEGNGVNIADNDNTPDAGDHTDFGSMSACSGSIVRTFTIRNTGNQPLTIGVPVIGGTAAADFTLTNAPASPVAAGSSTTFEVTFNPSVIGLRSATLSISNSDCNEDPFNFALAGTGTDPEIDIRGKGNSIADGDATPNTLDNTDFGNVAVGDNEAHTFEVHNTGNTNLSVNSIASDNPRFSVSSISPAGVIAPGQSASFTVTFNPTANGAQNATITVLNDDCDESIYTFAVTGYGCSVSTFTACPAPVSTNVNPGQCVASVNYVAMATGDPAPVLNYQFSGATSGSGGGTGSGNTFNKGITNVVISAVNTCGTTPTCAFTITVTDNQSPTITCPVGSPFARSAGLNECQYVVQGTEFDPTTAVDNCPGSTVTNSFNNSATLAGATLPEGPTTITWTITDAASLSATCQMVVDVSLPLVPKMTVRGNSQPITNNDNTPDAGDHTDFGAEPACLSPIVRTFTIQNTGGVDLNLGQIMITGANPGDFAVTGQPTNPVPANSTTTLEITFTPQAGGLRSASVSFTNNDCYTPDFRFDISGIGFGPEMELEGNFTGIADGHSTPNYTDYTDFGGVRACSGTFTRTFTIRNSSGAGLSLGAISITGPGAGDFTVTASPAGSVSVGSSTTFQITFDPSAVGLREATVSIANNDCLENPYDFAIQGTGTDPVLAVSGNSLTIQNGDASPAKTDHTDFGQVYLGGSQVRTRTFTLQNAGTGSLHITGISSDNPLFEVGTLTPPSPIPGNGTATVGVTFRPTTVSEQSATITISSNDCNTATFTFRVKGVTPILTDNVVDCRSVDNPLVDGELFINYGSVVDAYSIKNRSSYTVGEPAVGSSISPDNILYMGYWGRFLAPSLAPDVEATEGDLQDRILVKWYVNELGAAATEGFNIYRDSAFLAYAGKNVRSFNDFNVIAGKPYNYEVRGVNPYGEGTGGKAIGFMVPNGTVTGWVQTLSGRPVPEVLVTLTPSLGFSAKFEMDDEAFAKADTGTAENFLPETSNGEWTIAFWVKTDSAQNNAAIAGLEPFPLYFRPIGSAGGHEGIEVAQTATAAAILSHQFPDSTKNGWHHIALSRDEAGSGRLYVDGVLTGIGSLPPMPEANELLLGARTEAPGAWAGYLDELRIYHRRLDELDLGEVIMGTASSQTRAWSTTGKWTRRSVLPPSTCSAATNSISAEQHSTSTGQRCAPWAKPTT